MRLSWFLLLRNATHPLPGGWSNAKPDVNRKT